SAQVVRDNDDDNGETWTRPLVAIGMGLGKLVQLRYPPGSGRTNRSDWQVSPDGRCIFTSSTSASSSITVLQTSYMPPDPEEKNTNRSARLFGRGREARRPGDPLIVTGETTAWEIYNHKASEVDREMIKDWNDSLNTLLIFTALYSAVLTAFIIESMKLLEEDPTETTRDILLIISKQLANTSHPAFEQVAYETPRYAVVVNGLFFSSLSCALIAALLSVLALQWVANYDMGLNTSSPRKRALQRHIRFRGIEKWKMAEIIASLPLLIFVALFLFFIGIADWLWHMNRAISGIVIGGIGVGGLLYTITNLISIIKVEAPFRTPISKELVGMARQVMRWPLQITKAFSSRTRSEEAEEDEESEKEQQLTFIKHEEKKFEEKGAITLDGLLWLANHTEISPTSRDALIILIKELTEVPALSLMDEAKMKEAPWKAIFETLCTPYIGRDEFDGAELEMARWICKGMGIVPAFLSPTCYRFREVLCVSNDPAVWSVAYFATYQQRNGPSLHGMIVAFELTNESIGYNYLHFMLLNAKKEWPDMETWQRKQFLWSMARAWSIPSAVIRDGSSSIIIPVHCIELILDFAFPHVDSGIFEARFQTAAWADGTGEVAEWATVVPKLLQMMAQQLIVQISDRSSSLADYNKELELFSSITGIKRLNMTQEMDDFMWIMVTKGAGRGYSETLRVCEVLWKGLGSRSTAPAWVGLIPALDGFVTRLPQDSFHFYPNVIRFIDQLLSFSPGKDYFEWETLTPIQDPCIVWMVSWECPTDTQFHGLSHPNFGSWNDIMQNETIRLFEPPFYTQQTIVDSAARIDFLRAIILGGPSNVCTAVFNQLLRYGWDGDNSDKSLADTHNASFDRVLHQASNCGWFHEEFRIVNGLDWLPKIALSHIHDDGDPGEYDILT
ncbi:9426_t:CDS:2, partial [Acaulospora colombiana]